MLICAPIFLLVGGVGGAGALTLADKAANPPPDPLTQLEHKLSGFARENELQQQLLRAVRDKALAHWRLVPVSDQASMTVHLTALSLRGESPRQLSLTVMVTMTLRSAELPSYQARLPASADPKVGGAAADTGKPVPALLTRTFFYDGPTADISEWMDESGDLLKSTVALAYEAIAQRIVAALLPPSAG